MLKKILLAILIAFPFTAFAQAKYGIVDTQDVFMALPETAKMQEDITAASKKYEDEFAKLQDEFQKAYTEFQNLPADTPDAIKERRLNALQDLDNRIQQFRQTASQDLQRLQEAAAAPIQAKVQQAIKEVGDEGSYTFIFENMVPVYTGADVTDVTAAVKAKLGVK